MSKSKKKESKKKIKQRKEIKEAMIKSVQRDTWEKQKTFIKYLTMG